VKFSEVKELLDFKFEQFNAQHFIETDPICIPHRFSRKQDIEIAALLVATIAWGNRTMIINNGKKLLEIMGESPHEFIMEYGKSNKAIDLHFVHRTFNHEDLHFFFNALHIIYTENESLESVFKVKAEYPGIKGRILSFREEMLKTSHLPRSEKHISNPAKNSAAKRINMFIRIIKVVK